MKKLIWEVNDGNDNFYCYQFYCPGCKSVHGFNRTWQFNGYLQNPTVQPSLLTTGLRSGHRCHLYIEKGKIKYLSDCTHELAGQTVDMIDEETFIKGV